MKKIYTGKTKDVFDNGDGSYTLKFKDDATGKDGVFDPGENQVGLSIEGLGRESLRLTKYIYELLEAQGVPTQLLDCDLDAATMRVRPAAIFGCGIEFVCRCKATGSFLKRYGAYAQQGQDLGYLVEVTLKDDDRKDPPITKDSLVVLGIMSAADFDICKALTQQICKILAENLACKGLDLYDMKVEFARTTNGDIMLIDEISAGSMRVYKDDQWVQPMDLTAMILGE
ncbi:MAG: phosphoribosylaminoimidazolesuccinocarboxamide synthase [Oscillospiraceae bacterium]|nr:phosphoribosylaminoimidazolesuccinocarboxamide synthase [Oscillospiraceae bacterium]